MKDEILKKIGSLQQQIELENNPAFIEMVQYFRDSAKTCDDSWQYITSVDTEKFIELKAAKIAAINVINYISNLKSEVEDLRQELVQIDEQE